jgi:hypothetical protein
MMVVRRKGDFCQDFFGLVVFKDYTKIIREYDPRHTVTNQSTITLQRQYNFGEADARGRKN